MLRPENPTTVLDRVLVDLYMRMMELHADRLDVEGFNYWRKQYEDLAESRRPKAKGRRFA